MSDELLDDQRSPEESSQKPLHIGLKILCFLIPLAGLITYFVKRTNEPKAAQQACYATLIGIVFAIVLQLIIGGLASMG